jgi:glycosyltransferase involved in cell wall biosynthesis
VEFLAAVEQFGIIEIKHQIMDCSIVICTRNRAESLRTTLKSFGKVAVPNGWAVELLVVDNGSTDHTRAVANEVCLKNVTLKYISEPKSGQCHARNSGLNAASGEIILFTDDDIRVPSNWVVAMCQPIVDGIADATVGGVLFPAEYSGVLSQPAISSRRGWLASTEELNPKQPARMVGANMAFHRRVLDKVSKFDVELGPGALGFCDETLFSFQLLEAGYKFVGVFDVSVEHHFDLSRLTEDGLLDLARKMGRSHAFLFYHWEHKKSRLVIPRLILCHFRRLWMRFFGSNKSAGISDQILKLEEEMAFYREYIVQRRRAFKYSLRGFTPQATEVSA